MLNRAEDVSHEGDGNNANKPRKPWPDWRT